jgi:hypothetical protein
LEREDWILELEVTTWFETLESLSEDGSWIFETGKDSPAVDIIEFLTENPLIFCIINLETAIWRDALPSVHYQSDKTKEELTREVEWRSSQCKDSSGGILLCYRHTISKKNSKRDE